MTIYFAAEVYRSRIRRQTMRFFTDGRAAVEYYSKLGYGGTIWKATLDRNSPPQALTVAEIRELSKKE